MVKGFLKNRRKQARDAVRYKPITGKQANAQVRFKKLMRKKRKRKF